MKGTATIRDLRNRFTDVRKRLESDGEVVVTERGKPRYRLTLYAPPKAKSHSRIDYWKRLVSYQPRPLTGAQSRKLHEANRGER
jgi:prevent-host-death family protein